MLVLTRKKNEKLVIPEHNITITIVEIRGDKCRLGIEAPRETTIHRKEVQEEIERKERERIAKVAAQNGGPT